MGGAVGDALGAPVEFLDLHEIVERFGEDGISEFVSVYGQVGAITDDTQMTLFTAEGLLRAAVRFENKGICHVPSVIHHAYLRWLRTQGETPTDSPIPVALDGWLIELRPLWSQRAPGATCIYALRGAQKLGEPAKNNSKGCGGVMRVAPVGLVPNVAGVFELASEAAALTHGHPSGYLSAGFLADLIRRILDGASLLEATANAKRELRSRKDHEEVLDAIEKAERYASSQNLNALQNGLLGEGWVAEEALAIALYSSLVSTSFGEAVIRAANHDGDSDSTGAIAGNICGALFGVEAIADYWLNPLELRSEITQIADDLADWNAGTFDASAETTWQRYPGY